MFPRGWGLRCSLSPFSAPRSVLWQGLPGPQGPVGLPGEKVSQDPAWMGGVRSCPSSEQVVGSCRGDPSPSASPHVLLLPRACQGSWEYRVWLGPTGPR